MNKHKEINLKKIINKGKRYFAFLVIFLLCSGFDPNCGVGVEPEIEFRVESSRLENGKVKFYFIPDEDIFLQEINVNVSTLNFSDEIKYDFPYPAVGRGRSHIIKEYSDVVAGYSWKFTIEGVKIKTKKRFTETHYLNLY